MEKNGKGIITAGVLLTLAIAVIVTWTAAVKAIAGTNGGSGEVKEEVITAPVERIVVTEISEDVALRASADGKIKVVYRDTDNIIHRIDTSGSTLSVKAKQKKGGWLKKLFGGLFSFSFNREDKSQTIIYLPEGTYESLSIGTVSGDVDIPDIAEFGELEAATVSGDINADAAKISGNAGFETVSGDINLHGIQASSASANTVSGQISLTDADIAGEVTLETVSGDVSGNVLGSHSYDAHSLSGDKTFPAGTDGAPEVSVSTTSGDVELF